MIADAIVHSQYSSTQSTHVSLRLHQRPRKTLGFETPASRLPASVVSEPVALTVTLGRLVSVLPLLRQMAPNNTDAAMTAASRATSPVWPAASLRPSANLGLNSDRNFP